MRQQIGHGGEEREVEEAHVVEELVLRDEVHQPGWVGRLNFGWGAVIIVSALFESCVYRERGAGGRLLVVDEDEAGDHHQGHHLGLFCGGGSCTC